MKRVLLLGIIISTVAGLVAKPTQRYRCGGTVLRGEASDAAIDDLMRRAAALRRGEILSSDEAPAEADTNATIAAPSPEELVAERRREAEALAKRMSGEVDTSKWPKFKNQKQANARTIKPFGGALSGPEPRAELTAESMKDPELQSIVRRIMVDAFDNRRPDEVEVMFARLWAAGPINSVRKMVEAVLDARDVEEAYRLERLSPEAAADEIRSARSRVRMYAKDAEFLPNPDGSPAEDLWGSLDDWLPWRWRP